MYSGVVAENNGNTNDTTNFDRTYLRGIQPTDPDVISLFRSILHGHYGGRTTHIHVMAHMDATVMSKGTIMSTVASHVGQMYFDQDLIYEVEGYTPYMENTQELMLNVNDDLLAEGAATSDPILHWT